MGFSSIAATLLAVCFAVCAATTGARLSPASSSALGAALSKALGASLGAPANQKFARTRATIVCSTCLIRRFIRQSVTPCQGQVAPAQLQHRLRACRLPQAAITKAAAIAFSRAVVFKVFHFSVSTQIRQGRYMHVVGALRRVGNSVHYGIFQATVHASLVTKYTVVRRRRCKRRFFWKRCKNYHTRVVRGYTAAEIAKIRAELNRRALQLILPRVRRLNRPKRDASAEEDDDNSLRDYISVALEELPSRTDVEEAVETGANSSVIGRVVNRGFAALSRSIQIHSVNGVDPSMYQQYTAYALRALGMTTNASAEVRRRVFDRVRDADDTEWRSCQVMFQTAAAAADESNRCQFVTILGRRNTRRGYDFVQATFTTELSLAPDLLIVRSSHSSSDIAEENSENAGITLVEAPASISVDEVMALFKVLDAATLARFARYVNIQLPLEVVGPSDG